MKKHLPHYLLILLLWLSLQQHFAFAQGNRIDSLKNILRQTTDTSRVNTLNHIAYELYNITPEEAIKAANEAVQLATKIGYTRGLAESYDLIGRSYFKLNDLEQTLKYFLASADNYKAINDPVKLGEEYNEIGVIYKNLGQYDKAINFYNSAIENFDKVNYPLGNGNAYVNMGQAYSYLGNYEKAIEFYIKSIKIWEELDDQDGLALANGNLGNLYYNLREYSKSLEYFQEAKKLFIALDKQHSLATLLNNIGLIYNSLDDNEKALEYFESALELSKTLDYKSGMALALSNTGRIHQDEKQYQEAIKNYKDAIHLFKEINNKSLESGRLIDLGEVYTSSGNYQEAFSKLTEGLQLAIEINDAGRELYSYKALFEYFEVTKDYNQSLAYYKKYAALKDSVFNIQKREQITEIQTRYETEKKEQENELLRKERVIREETITRKESQNRLLLIVILFILSFAGYFYIVYRQKQKTNHLLQRQNEEINLKQEEIININASLQKSQDQLSKANEELQNLNSNLEATVRERTSALQKSHVELDTFLYQSSHALRRPIVSIMGLIQIARLETQKEQIEMIWDKIEDTSNKMDLMLRKLVMASEINISQFDPLKSIDFKTLVDETWSTLSNNFNTENILFKTDLNPINNFSSKEVLIRILLHNILENAILYAQESSQQIAQIKVTIKTVDGAVSIEILDNGVGIASELTDRIFDMFIVATDRPKGFGLGLYIVKKAVEKLKGDIIVKQTDDHFTSFQILLPYNRY